jgi:hypothetical protein
MQAAPAKPSAADLISLLSAYGTQFGSYTTLLWQVPALSLTAQSFLMTIALSSGNTGLSRVIASLLSAVVAWASFALMHDQRGHAINHGELARRLSAKLDLKELLGSLEEPDANPARADAETVWTAWDHTIYAVWKGCMVLFFVVDLVVIVSTLSGASWFTH